jgi:hypothetical protein
MGIGRALAEDPAGVTNLYTIGNINMVSRPKKVDEEDLVEALLAEEMWARVSDGVEAEEMRRKEAEEMRRKEVKEETLRVAGLRAVLVVLVWRFPLTWEFWEVSWFF